MDLPRPRPRRPTPPHRKRNPSVSSSSNAQSPFTAPSTPPRQSARPSRRRSPIQLNKNENFFPPNATSLFHDDSARSPLTRETLLVSLESLLARKSYEINMVGRLGEALLSQQSSLESEIHSMEDFASLLPTQSDTQEIKLYQKNEQLEQVISSLRQKLFELEQTEHRWRSENRNLFPPQFLDKTSVISPESEENSIKNNINIKRESMVSTQSSKSSIDDRSINTEFAAEINESLLLEVRRLQTLLDERDEILRQVRSESDQVEKDKAALRGLLKTAENRLEAFKDENWNLELSVQESRTQVANATEAQSRMEAERSKLSRYLRTAQDTIDTIKNEKETLVQARESLASRLETEVANSRKTKAAFERDRHDLTTEIESLKAQLVNVPKQSNIKVSTPKADTFDSTTPITSEFGVSPYVDPKGFRSARSIQRTAFHNDLELMPDESDNIHSPSIRHDPTNEVKKLRDDLASSRRKILKLRETLMKVGGKTVINTVKDSEEENGSGVSDSEIEGSDKNVTQRSRSSMTRGRGRQRRFQGRKLFVSSEDQQQHSLPDIISPPSEDTQLSSDLTPTVVDDSVELESITSTIPVDPFTQEESPDAFEARMGFRDLTNNLDILQIKQMRRIPSQSSLLKGHRPCSVMFSAPPKDGMKYVESLDGSFEDQHASPLAKYYKVQLVDSGSQTEEAIVQEIGVQVQNEERSKAQTSEVCIQACSAISPIPTPTQETLIQSSSESSPTIVHPNSESSNVDPQLEESNFPWRHPFVLSLSSSIHGHVESNRDSIATLPANAIAAQPFGSSSETTLPSTDAFDSEEAGWSDSDVEFDRYTDEEDSVVGTTQEETEMARSFRNFTATRARWGMSSQPPESVDNDHTDLIKIQEEDPADNSIQTDIVDTTPRGLPNTESFYNLRRNTTEIDSRERSELLEMERAQTPAGRLAMAGFEFAQNSTFAESIKRPETRLGILRPTNEKLRLSDSSSSKGLARSRSLTLSHSRLQSPFQTFGSESTTSVRYRPPRPSSPPPVHLLKQAHTPTIAVQSDRLGLPMSPTSSAHPTMDIRSPARSMPPPITTNSSKRDNTFNLYSPRTFIQSPAFTEFGSIQEDTQNMGEARIYPSTTSFATTPLNRKPSTLRSPGLTDYSDINYDIHRTSTKSPMLRRWDEDEGVETNEMLSSRQLGPLNEMTDPMIIHAITQTMIGEFLFKYTRKIVTKEISEKRHQRFFWVHPYTKTLYWSEDDPGSAKRSQSNSKSVSIEGIRQIVDSNPQPPGLPHNSLIIETRDRSIKLTAMNKERHEIWFNAINYILNRPTKDTTDIGNGEAVRSDTPSPVVYHSTPGRPAGRRRSLGPSRYFSAQKRAETPATDYLERTMDFGSPVRTTEGGSEFVNHEDADAEGNGFAEEGGALRAMTGGQDELGDFDGVENVRVCCSGEHTLHDLTNTSIQRRHTMLNRLTSEQKRLTISTSAKRSRHSSLTTPALTPITASFGIHKHGKSTTLASMYNRNTKTKGSSFMSTPNLLVPNTPIRSSHGTRRFQGSGNGRI